MTRPHHPPRTPARMTHGPLADPPYRTAAEQEALRARSGIRLVASPDQSEAMRRWEAHLDAGRIGAPSPPPPAGAGGDYRLASLEAILGIGASRRGGR